MNRTPPSLNISSPYMGLAGHADDDDVSPIVRVADNIVAATGLVFIIPAVTAFKRKLFFECWVIACIVPINLVSIYWFLVKLPRVVNQDEVPGQNSTVT